MSTGSATSASPRPTSSDGNERRNPRRAGGAKVTYEPNLDSTNGSLEADESLSKEENEEEMQEEVEEEMEKEVEDKEAAGRKKASNRKRSKSEDKTESQGRRSARSTKFTSSMKDPKEDDDFLERVSTPIKTIHSKKVRKAPADQVSPTKPKSPAIRHSTQRRRVETAVLMSTDEDGSEEASDEENDDDDDEDSMKIQRILACKTLTRKEWKMICDKMNTSEVDFGSRWFQEEQKDKEVLGDSTFEERFLVKWSELSYLHNSWETEVDLIDQVDNAKNYLTTFFRKSKNGLLFSADERCDGDFFDPGYIQVDRILQVHLPEDSANAENNKYGIIVDRTHKDFESGTGRQFLIKWTNMSYSEATFEFERDLILNEIEYEEQVKNFLDRSVKPTKSDMKVLFKLGEEETRRTYKIFGDKSKLCEKEKDIMVAAYQKDLADEMYPNGGQLRDYQAEGVSWMIANLINERSSILADEMGLGKTLQTCSFINLVANHLNKRGPFLVIAPLSTLQHWHREFTSWTGLNAIIYHGSAKDRELIREHEFAFDCDKPKSGVAFNSSYLKKCMPRGKPSIERQWMAQVVITTPELLVADDFSELTAVEWEVLVVDEAHRLKNHSSKLAVNLRDNRFQFNHTLLLTGTPIQNDMKELWTLLNFIDPGKFCDIENFLENYGDIKSKEKIDELHETIRPFILRRLKEDVEKSVPPKEETLIEVELTVLQKQYYRALYEKNVQFLHRNKKRALDGPSISNLAMQLRKCCNHPFLLRGVEDEIRQQEMRSEQRLTEGDFLVKFSGKLVLLDKLLPRLKATGHRVLIFSQFKIMLDIIEDYLNERKMKAERIDGSITGKKRQMAIDRFQATDVEGKEAPFVMMLSTRAGGVGINLTAADTCIIFDSDWNPQNDLQAQARCHRIGQTKMVKVYRLLTRKTYEMQMFHMSSMKMGLDQAVLGGFESKDGSGEGAMTKEEVERLLRHGAYDIFNEDKAGVSEAESSAFEQQDIDTILERRSKTVIHENTGSKSNVAGSTFSKASFKAPKAADGSRSAGDDDVDIDDPDFWKKMVGEGQLNNDDLDLGGQKRKRRETTYCEKDYKKQLDTSILLSDSNNTDDDSSASDVDQSSDESIDYMIDNTGLPNGNEVPKKRERARWGTTSKLSNTCQWNKSDAEKLLKGLQLYGYGCMPWSDFCTKISVADCDINEAQRICWAFLLIAIQEAAHDDVVSAQKRAIRAAEKKREEEGNKDDFSSGILGQTEILQIAAATVDIEGCFKKLWDIHRTWIVNVLEDAVIYAKSHRARPKESLQRAIHLTAVRSGNGEEKEVKAVFAQNVWPALKSRGWTIETVESENGSSTRYVKGDQSFRTVHTVLGAVPAFHPELAVMVESIQSSLASSVHATKVVLDDDFYSKLGPNTISAASLVRLLEHFAPLQLLVDRTTPKKIGLPRKVLFQCAFMKVANDYSGPLVNTSFNEDVLRRISSMLVIDKRVILPHPQWTINHDAVLIFAVAKHGWIEHDICIRNITEDTSIKWGAPFESTKTSGSLADQKNISEETLKALFNGAARVASFLNHEQETLDSVKGFKKQLLVKSFGLVYAPSSQRGADFAKDNAQVLQWEVDAALLRKAAGAANVNDENLVPNQENVDLPTKKDLLRRARAVLANPPDKSMTKAAPKGVVLVPARTDHTYCVLDQSDPANLFLAELLRSLVKVSFNNSGKRKNIGRRLCTYALDEANQRVRDDLPSESLEVMTKIVDHLMLVGRFIQTKSLQAKNVIRVILGITPIVPKNPADPIFPTDYRNTLTIIGGAETTIDSVPAAKAPVVRSQKPRNESAIGDQAISLAMSKAMSLVEVSEQLSSSGKALESSLQLTTPETLLLTVMGSQGLPVWTCAWNDVVEGENISPELQGPGCDCVISWDGMGRVFEAAAELWHTTAEKKLAQRQSTFIATYGNINNESIARKQATKKLLSLEQDVKAKFRALAIAADYSNNPRKLAKKCIMLVEALRKKMGPVDSKPGGKKAKTIRRSEHGLGPYVLLWFDKENTRWAESFKIIDSTGKPYGYTAVDFFKSDKSKASPADDDIDIAAVLDEKGCRNIFTQIAQQTRARSLFLRYTKLQLQEWVSTAVKNCDVTEDEWEGRPSWWNNNKPPTNNHDFLLMENLLEYGFSGIDEPLRLMAPLDLDGDESLSTNHMSRGKVQDRANQLTRELHMIEETSEAMQKYLSVRRDVSAVIPTVQSGIQSFFGASSIVKNATKLAERIENGSPPITSKRKEASVNSIDLIEEVDVLSPGKSPRLSFE